MVPSLQKYSSKYFSCLLNEVKKEAKKWNYTGKVDSLGSEFNGLGAEAIRARE
jgi:hypothetical protein